MLDLGVTQVANPSWGVHVLLPAGAISRQQGRPARNCQRADGYGTVRPQKLWRSSNAARMSFLPSASAEDVIGQPARAQFEAFLDEHRSDLSHCLDG
jgi:hypothetical protein